MRRLVTALALCLVLPAASEAQLRFGMGIGLQNSNVFIEDEIGIVNSIAPVVYAPIVLGNGIVVEPGIGYFRMKMTDDGDFGESELTVSAIRLNVGVLFVLASPERGRVYAGPRVGVTRLKTVSESDGEDGESKRMDLIFAGVAGGEFFLMPAFSLGGEIGLAYTSTGETEFDPDPGFEDEEDLTVLGLTSEFRVRWYIN